MYSVSNSTRPIHAVFLGVFLAVLTSACGLVALINGATTSARADGPPQPRVVHAIDRYPYLLWRESWGGAEMLANSWSVYSGSTIALTGDIEGEGWRLRTTGGYGQYRYRKWMRGLNGPEHVKFTGRKTFSDVLLGYHVQWHGVTLKAFGGISTEQHIVDPRDTENAATGSAYGGKVALEAWLSLSKRHWLATDVSWASALNAYKLGARTGYQISDDLDLGVETRLEGDDAYTAGRAGTFITLRHGDAGLTASAGITGDRDLRTSHYASVNLFIRY